MRDGRVRGVRVAGRADGVVEAPIVIAADGVVSLLAKEAGLHDGFKSKDLALGVRALFRLDEGELDGAWACAARRAPPTSTSAAPRACAAAPSSTRSSTA